MTRLRLKEWASTWEAFNDARVAAAVGAFVLLVVAVDLSRAGATTGGRTRAPYPRARSSSE